MLSGKVLFIDAYDSFSNSIISLLESELAVIVESIKIDDARFVLNDGAFFRFLDEFDAVVAGPGPGHPENPGDIGLIGRLWCLPDEHVLPVLGICLGFQSLCHAFGGRIERLREPRHGIVANVTHCEKDIFAGTGEVVATQYHSLHVRLERGERVRAECSNVWESFQETKDLLPLAWDFTNISNGPVLMAVKHQKKPFWGVQYHPESICTNKAGRKLIPDWWRAVSKSTCLSRGHTWLPEGPSVPSIRSNKTFKDTRVLEHIHESICTRQVEYVAVQLSSNVEPTSLMELFDSDHRDVKPLLLESGTRNGRPVNAETGRFSILALRDKSSLQLRYYTSTHRLWIESGCKAIQMHGGIADVFKYIDDLLYGIKASGGPSQTPFWGGLLGFISYEAGLETIGVGPSETAVSRPDMWFMLADRTIVIDHVAHIAYVQSIRGNDNGWLMSSVKKIESFRSGPSMHRSSGDARAVEGTVTREPLEEDYRQKINACKSSLRAGESYELCLTDQSTVTSSMEPWELYCRLRKCNPAPFGSFLRFSSHSQPGISIVGSSPERFLSWTRQGRCQFRPIKGTVKKTIGMTRAKAEMLLSSAKERAENLMIVDLIRHDLSSVLGVGQVQVPKLMCVEEYETVFQLVSVIEGGFDSSTSPTAALAASLPPGSMTGAPKKRSCELLKAIEDEQPRGLYSGVIGYFDAGGGGDFSVVIRTAFKWDNGGDTWNIGAGGAITVLSEAGSEWEEMLTKRESVLQSIL